MKATLFLMAPEFAFGRLVGGESSGAICTASRLPLWEPICHCCCLPSAGLVQALWQSSAAKCLLRRGKVSVSPSALKQKLKRKKTL